jgi:nucleosome binding factor SPN SPT16 subunit
MLCVERWRPSTRTSRSPPIIDAFSSAAKILAQIQSDAAPVPVEIFAQAKSKEAPNDALPKFAESYASHRRVGALLKETHTGKLIDSWNAAVAELPTKPELVDMAPAISTFMAVKDEEELVRFSRGKVTPTSLIVCCRKPSVQQRL